MTRKRREDFEVGQTWFTRVGTVVTITGLTVENRVWFIEYEYSDGQKLTRNAAMTQGWVKISG